MTIMLRRNIFYAALASTLLALPAHAWRPGNTQGSQFDNSYIQELAREQARRKESFSEKSFIEHYMQCGNLREEKKTDDCSTAWLRYCDWLDHVPVDVRENLELQLECNQLGVQQAGSVLSEEEQQSPAAQRGCYTRDAETLALLRKYYGKDNEVRALLFFISGLERESKVCRKGKW